MILYLIEMIYPLALLMFLNILYVYYVMIKKEEFGGSPERSPLRRRFVPKRTKVSQKKYRKNVNIFFGILVLFSWLPISLASRELYIFLSGQYETSQGDVIFVSSVNNEITIQSNEEKLTLTVSNNNQIFEDDYIEVHYSPRSKSGYIISHEQIGNRSIEEDYVQAELQGSIGTLFILVIIAISVHLFLRWYRKQDQNLPLKKRFIVSIPKYLVWIVRGCSFFVVLLILLFVDAVYFGYIVTNESESSLVVFSFIAFIILDVFVHLLKRWKIIVYDEFLITVHLIGRKKKITYEGMKVFKKLSDKLVIYSNGKKIISIEKEYEGYSKIFDEFQKQGIDISYEEKY